MDRPTPVLVLITYDFEQKPVNQLYPVKSIQEVDPAECSPRCRLEGDREWLLYTHIRTPDRSAIAQLAIRLPGAALGYQAAISPDGHTWEEMLRFEDTDCVYFYMATRYKKVKNKDGSVDWQPRSGGAAGNIVSAGAQWVRVSCGGEQRTVQLRIRPSGISEEAYAAILQDILLIQRELLLGKTGPVSAGDRWETAALDLEWQVERMGAVVRQLEAVPDRKLTAAAARLPRHKIKHFTPRTALDQAAGRRRLHTRVYQESYDIYEHRMIRTYLERLRELAAGYRMLEQQKRLELLRNLNQEISGSGESYAQAIQQRRAQARQAIDGILKKLSAKPNLRLTSLDRSITLLVAGKPAFVWNEKAKWFEIILRPAPNGAAPVLEAVRGGTRRPLLHLLLKSRNHGNCEGTALFLYGCARRLQARWAQDQRPFFVTFAGHFLWQGNPKDGFWAEICGLDSMSDAGAPYRYEDFFAEQEPAALLRTYQELLRQGGLTDSTDRLFYNLTLLEQLDFQSSLVQTMGGQRWDAAEREINRLLRTSPILREAGSGERLHITNLFSMHPLYRQAYQLMRKTEKQWAGIDLWGASVYRLEKTEQIYEVWCLLKMLSILICDYSFTLLEPDGRQQELSALIHDFLRDGGLSQKTFRLEKRSGALEGMRVRLDYDALKKAKEGGELRPDFFLVLSTEGVQRLPFDLRRTCNFCMDAKYHNYAPDRMTLWAWYYDVLDVAWEKYIVRLGKDGLVSGSYILHADAGENRPEIREYFWSNRGIPRGDGLLEDNSSHTLEGRIPKYLSRRGNGANIWPLLRQLEELEDCQLGAVCFLPDNRGQFLDLMQMLMEHYMGLYQYQCWNCGSEELTVEQRETAAGWEKYYIVCESCKSFWVETHCWSCRRQLGKHQQNYYRTANDDCWNVICPSCKSNASRGQ